ncbi:MAG: DUF2752 domain-containing protein [Chitinophagaceae bacterium]|nr:DUF2752 domain-containing protein [Chitinophagaceae bacterium]
MIIFVSVIYLMPERLFASPFGNTDLCMLRQLFDIPCPGCGMTRSFYYLLHADIDKCLYYNRSGILLAPVILIEIIRKVWKKTILESIRSYLHLFFLLILLTNYVIKLKT